MSKPPIPCKGYRVWTGYGHEHDCEYEFAGQITCEDCIVNGGDFDPRLNRYNDEDDNIVIEDVDDEL